MKNAICILIFGNELYITGACINAYINRKFIQKLNLDIKLVAMVDSLIYEYKEELEKYFDQIELIDLIEIKMNKNYYVSEKYSKWMKYTINKWQILKLIDYDKVLLLDADILPVNDDFYTVFNIKTPGFCSKGFQKNNIEFPIDRFIDESDNNFTMDKCWNFSKKFKKAIDAGIALLKPDIKLYNEYIKFISTCAGEQGYISASIAGVDETIIIIFYLFYKKIPLYSISYNYAIIPWQKYDYNLKEIKGFNFMSFYKPWVLLPMLQWGEQNIWHKIAKKALVKSKVITDIYVKYLFIYLKNFIDNYEKYINKKDSPFNTEGVKLNKNLFEQIKKIIIQNKDLDMNYENQKKIMDLSQSIHKYMDKKSIVSFSQIEKLLN